MVGAVLSGPRLLLLYLLCKTFGCSLFLSFSLLWVLVLCLSRGICRKSVNKGDDYLFDINFGVELRSRREERSKGVEMEFISENLA